MGWRVRADEEGSGWDDLLGVKDVLNLLDYKLQLDLCKFGALVQFVTLGSGEDIQTLEEWKILVFHLVMMFQNRLDTLDHVSSTVLVSEAKITIETGESHTIKTIFV